MRRTTCEVVHAGMSNAPLNLQHSLERRSAFYRFWPILLKKSVLYRFARAKPK